MAIPKETIDRVRESLDIVDVIREYVPNIKKIGKDYRSLCPFHQDKKPSFYVSPSKNIFHCFGCHVGGDVFKFVMQYENISYTEAIKKLAPRTGITIEDFFVERDTERTAIFEVLEKAAVFYNRHLSESKEAEPARKYLAKRGMKDETVKTFRLGFAPDGNKFVEQAKKNYTADLLLKTGLAKISERTNTLYNHLHSRIVFPIFNFQGNVTAFGGRILPGHDTGMPVYMNTFETAVFSKSNSLYGLFQAKNTLRETKKAVIFEGYMDVIINHQEGITNAVAPLGTALTSKHIETLKRFAETLYMVFDPDESGINAAIRSGEMCLEQDITCKIVLLPGGQDPDEYVLKEGKENFEKLLETGVNPVEFKLNHSLLKYDISKPEGKRDLIKDIIETIKKINGPTVRHEMIRLVSSRLDLSEDIILSEIRSTYKKNMGSPKYNAPSALDSMDLRVGSVEEEIIWLCLHHPHLCKSVTAEFFTDVRCSRVLPLLMQMNDKNISFANLLDSLEENMANWLTRLSFEERDYSSDYSSPEKAMESLIKDLNSLKQEEKRRELEVEVISMLEGRLSFDPVKAGEFQRLTRILKGSKLN
jgi:DNA primase